MSRGQTLRALLNDRLAAAAEEIFVLFERTIAEYEEELCQLKKEQNIQTPWTCPGSGLNQEITETLWIKEEPEEQCVKEEEEQLPVPVPESSAVCVKTEESSLVQRRQTEHQEETLGEDISSEPHFHLETAGHTEDSSDTDNDDSHEPYRCSAEQMWTEADGDRDKLSENMSGVHGGGADRKKHQCSFCTKSFGTKQHLETHIRVHTGEKPYSCSICERTFTQKSHLESHKRRHTGDKPYSCSTCEKRFSDKRDLDSHMRAHTGEKPYSCSNCDKHFANPSALCRHRRTHTGEKPYSCSICKKTFAQKTNLDSHHRLHTGERPYSCSICEKTFVQKCNLDSHKRSHTREKTYGCVICGEIFFRKCHLKSHMSSEHP